MNRRPRGDGALSLLLLLLLSSLLLLLLVILSLCLSVYTYIYIYIYIHMLLSLLKEYDRTGDRAATARGAAGLHRGGPGPRGRLRRQGQGLQARREGPPHRARRRPGEPRGGTREGGNATKKSESARARDWPGADLRQFYKLTAHKLTSFGSNFPGRCLCFRGYGLSKRRS